MIEFLRYIVLIVIGFRLFASFYALITILFVYMNGDDLDLDLGSKIGLFVDNFIFIYTTMLIYKFVL